MTIELSERAQRMLNERLATGKYSSPMDVIERALKTLENHEDTIRAIEEGIADMEAGRTYTAEEVFRRLEEKYPYLREG